MGCKGWRLSAHRDRSWFLSQVLPCWVHLHGRLSNQQLFLSEFSSLVFLPGNVATGQGNPSNWSGPEHFPTLRICLWWSCCIHLPCCKGSSSIRPSLTSMHQMEIKPALGKKDDKAQVCLHFMAGCCLSCWDFSRIGKARPLWSFSFCLFFCHPVELSMATCP